MNCRLGHHILSLLTLLLASAAWGAQVYSVNVDIDENILSLISNNIIYEKGTNRMIGVANEEWPIVKGLLGKPGPYEMYETRSDTFRYTGAPTDPPGKNYFFTDLRKSLRRKGREWKGPHWIPFEQALANPVSAEWVHLITARGHSPENLYQAFRFLKREGKIARVPLIENSFPVSHPGFNPKHPDGSSEVLAANKANALSDIMDRIQREKLSADDVPVLDSYGKGWRPMHVATFSDDNLKNFQKIVEHLSANVAKWPDVKVIVEFTGKPHKGISPHAEVIQHDGITRGLLPEERDEFFKVIAPRCLPGEAAMRLGL